MPSLTSVPWRRNQITITLATFIGFTSFTLVMPFLPLYFEQLGVHDTGAIAIWSGLSLGVTPAITAALAPLWARVADLYGRKLMVVRSLTCFVVAMLLMAYVTQPWQVFGLRAALGFFAGYGPVAMTMAAESAPPAEMASALGWVQTSQRLGPALGPVIGGVLAQTVGLRHAFLVAAGIYAAALVLTIVGYREAPKRIEVAHGRSSKRVTLAMLRHVRHFVLIMVGIFSLQLVDRSFGPILPLYLRDLGVNAARVSFVSGVIFTVTAGVAAVGNQATGWLLDRWSARRVLTSSTLLAALGAVLFGIRLPVSALFAAAGLLGLGIGVATTTLYTAAGRAVADNDRGVAFGYLSTAYLLGLAISPVVAGLIAARSLRAIFLLDAIGMIVLAWIVRARMIPDLSR